MLYIFLYYPSAHGNPFVTIRTSDDESAPLNMKAAHLLLPLLQLPSKLKNATPHFSPYIADERI